MNEYTQARKTDIGLGFELFKISEIWGINYNGRMVIRNISDEFRRKKKKRRTKID